MKIPIQKNNIRRASLPESLLTIGLFFIPILFVQAQEIITLEAALDTSSKNNLEIREADFQARLSKEEVRQTQMNRFPSLNGSANADLNGGNFFDERTGIVGNMTNKSLSGQVQLSLPVFQGFQQVNQLAANKYILQSDKSNSERVRNNLQLSVMITYLEALSNRDLLKVSEQQLVVSQKQLEQEEINMTAGNNTLADVSQAKSQVAKDEMSIMNAQNAYELAILSLKQLMEINPQRQIYLENPSPHEPDSLFSYTAEDVYREAAAIFPEIQQATFNTLSAKKELAVSKGGFYPHLSLSGGLYTGFTTTYKNTAGGVFPFQQQLRDNFGQTLGLTLSIPIFNNFHTRIEVNKAKIVYQQALVNEKQAKNDLNKIINEAVLDFYAAKKNYQSANQTLTAMENTFSVYRERYQAGMANSMELSIAQSNRNTAELDAIRAQYNLLFKTKVIEFYLNKPIKF